jgi:acyl-CoA synthetase (NDP forming)
VTRPRLDDLVTARAVAVIGASQDPARIGGRPVRFLREGGFTGVIHPVNVKYTEVQGLPCYPDLASVPGPVDIAIVSVPARDVAATLAACAAKGVKGAVVFSSGFGEVGAEGRALQDEIARIARETGVRVIGPNCQGWSLSTSASTSPSPPASSMPASRARWGWWSRAAPWAG